MQYEGQICRSPMERGSYMLPVMVGCTYNRCRFCNLFRHLSYRILSLEQIEEELSRVHKIGGNPRKVFLGDGNAFGLKTARLVRILDLIHDYFPGTEEVNMDATVTSILSKSEAELKLLYQKGVRHLYIGIESGLDDVLKFMQKEHNQREAYEAIDRVKNAGMIFDAHIMTGVAGNGRGRENAEALAVFLNRTGPRHVVNFSMFLHTQVPLYQEIEAGRFSPADELENLKEEACLLQELCAGPEGILYEGFHDFISFRIRGCLPRDRDKMLSRLKLEIERQEKEPRKFAYTSLCWKSFQKTD